MGYASITFLLFVAYIPLIWIIFRIRQRSKGLGYFAAVIFLVLLLGVWIVGFLNRIIMVGAIEHLIIVGSVTTLTTVIFELTISRINLLVRFKRRREGIL